MISNAIKYHSHPQLVYEPSGYENLTDKILKQFPKFMSDVSILFSMLINSLNEIKFETFYLSFKNILLLSDCTQL